LGCAVYQKVLGRKNVRFLIPTCGKPIAHENMSGKNRYRMFYVREKSDNRLFVSFVGLTTSIVYFNQGPSSECAGNDVLFITTGDRAHGLLGAYFHRG
jgi:hypothetical protein